MFFSVGYECIFDKEGVKEFFFVVLKADSFSIALDSALDYAVDHYPNCDVSIKSIIKL